MTARDPVGRVAGVLAVLGGVAMLVAAAVATASVLRRWLTNDPIPGDFEIVSIGSGVAVFLCLAHATRRRTDIVVDTFTAWLPARVQGVMDAFWSLAWAAAALWIAERMVIGAFETRASGTVTMVLGFSTWWAVLIGALSFALVAVAALIVAWHRARGEAA